MTVGLSAQSSAGVPGFARGGLIPYPTDRGICVTAQGKRVLFEISTKEDAI